MPATTKDFLAESGSASEDSDVAASVVESVEEPADDSDDSDGTDSVEVV